MSRRPAPTMPLTDLEALDLFVDLADELAATRLIQAGFETSLVIRAGGLGRMTVTAPAPDEDDFRSMLVALRKLIADGEPTQIGRVHNLIEKHVLEPALVAAARESRSILAGATAGAAAKPKDAEARGPGLFLEGQTPGEIADMYLNGRYFHADPGKRGAIEKLTPEMAELTRYFLRQYALEAVRQIAATSNIIRAAKASGKIA